MTVAGITDWIQVPGENWIQHVETASEIRDMESHIRLAILHFAFLHVGPTDDSFSLRPAKSELTLALPTPPPISTTQIIRYPVNDFAVP